MSPLRLELHRPSSHRHKPGVLEHRPNATELTDLECPICGTTSIFGLSCAAASKAGASGTASAATIQTIVDEKRLGNG